MIQTIGALLWRQGRERFRALAIPREAIEEAEPRMIAGVLLAEREFTGDEIDVLWRDDGRSVSWGDSIELFAPDEPAWAVRCVERFARDYARRWLPAVLEWVARCLRSDGWRFERAANELDQILRLASLPERAGVTP